jgi:type IV secretory pathway VirB10-like protein
MGRNPVNVGDVSADPARVTDCRTMPPGVMPRHLQQWVLVGIALVMVGILGLSGSFSKSRSSAAPSPNTSAVDPNQQRIEEYQRHIQDQAQRLAAEQAQLQVTKEAVAGIPGVPASTAPPGTRERATEAEAPPVQHVPREERALFADNVAYTRPARVPVATGDSASISARESTLPPIASLSSAPVLASTAPATVAESGASSNAPPKTPANRATVRPTSNEPQFSLLEGTLIETVLTNRLDGTFSGPVNCLVSVPVYASDREHLVIPAGSRVLGDARAVNAFGQSRLAVVFHRVILPNGTHVDLDGFHGLNQVGALGLQDQVDRHYAQIFGVSLAIGAIAGLAQARSSVGMEASGLDAYGQGAAANVSQSSARILDRFLNILPTVTIREGHRIKVYLSNDLELPAYRDGLPVTGGQP